MGAVLLFFLNLFIVAGAVLPFLAAVMLIVYRTAGLQERLLRGLAMFTAGLLALGVHAAGLTVGRGVLSTLEFGGAAGLVSKVAWTLLAGACGALLGRYLTRNLIQSTALQIRVMVFTGTLAHLELLDIYISSLGRNGFSVGAGAIPVIAFISSFLLYLVLRWDPEAVKRVRGGLPHRAATTELGAEQGATPVVPLIADEKYIDLFGEKQFGEKQ